LRAATLLRELGGLIFPPCCQLCGRLAQPLVCERCAAAFEAITPPLCGCCGRPFDPHSRAGERCGRCRATGHALSVARSFGLHVGTLRGAVNALKFGGRTRLVGPLAELLTTLVEGSPPVALPPMDGPVGLVPVPLHPTRRRDRGFDQAELLATCLGELTGLPLRAGLLVRTRSTRPQVGMTPSERRENVKGAFALRHPLPHTEARVVLIDDVYTTGATLEECARVLRRGGAAQVGAITVTRAAPEWHPQADLGDTA